jgi:hypothetical protein
MRARRYTVPRGTVVADDKYYWNPVAGRCGDPYAVHAHTAVAGDDYHRGRWFSHFSADGGRDSLAHRHEISGRADTAGAV